MKKYVCYICILQFCFLSAFLNAAEVEFSRGKDNVRVSNGTNYTRLGNTMHGSDGSRYTQIGNTTYGSDGTRYTQVGNTTYSSNGSSYTRRGNVTTGSDGSRYAANGNTTNASYNTGKIDANPKKMLKELKMPLENLFCRPLPGVMLPIVPVRMNMEIPPLMAAMAAALIPVLTSMAIPPPIAEAGMPTRPRPTNNIFPERQHLGFKSLNKFLT